MFVLKQKFKMKQYFWKEVITLIGKNAPLMQPYYQTISTKLEFMEFPRLSIKQADTYSFNAFVQLLK